MGSTSCKSLLGTETGLLLPLERHRGTVGAIMGAFFFVQIFLLGAFYCYKYNKDIYEREENWYCLIVLTIISMPLCVWFFVNLFVGLYEDFVVIYYYEPIKGLIKSKNENPYRCCVVESCVCQEAGSLPTCASRLASLTEGSCGNGYYCCNQFCTSRSCGSRGRSTCTSCYCVRDVSSRRCNSRCGNCYRPFVQVTFQLANKIYTGKIS